MNLAEYFEANRPASKFEFGQRVFGYYEKIPFIGSVGSDTMRSVDEGVMATITLDLPIKTSAGVRTVIRVPHKAIKSTLVSL